MFLFEIPPDLFDDFTLMAEEVCADGESDPTLIIKHDSDAYHAFRNLCLQGEATQPIVWEIPSDCEDLLYARFKFFGDEDQEKWTLPCNARAPFDAMDNIRGPFSVLAIMHRCCILVQIE